jgi:hypothetical protein
MLRRRVQERGLLRAAFAAHRTDQELPGGKQNTVAIWGPIVGQRYFFIAVWIAVNIQGLQIVFESKNTDIM